MSFTERRIGSNPPPTTEQVKNRPAPPRGPGPRDPSGRYTREDKTPPMPQIKPVKPEEPTLEFKQELFFFFLEKFSNGHLSSFDKVNDKAIKATEDALRKFTLVL